jgi:hypothetical protein
MNGIVLARRKYGDLDKFADEVRTKMSARILNLMAEEFSDYVRRSKLSGQVLSVRSGKTRESMGFYQMKKAKSPTYVVRPGRGINGRLNYLGGMSRGMMIMPKRGEWVYIRDDSGKITARVKSAIVRSRPFMAPAWQEWKGNARGFMKGVYNAYVERAFSGSGVETL